MPGAVERLARQIQSVDIGIFNDNENGRAELLSAARELCQRLETPGEFLQRITCLEPPLLAALKIGIDIQLFKHLSEVPQPVTILAQLTDTCPRLLRRVLRLLAVQNIVHEFGLSRMSNSFFERPDYSSGSDSKIPSGASTSPISRKNSVISVLGTTLSNISHRKSIDSCAMTATSSPISPEHHSGSSTPRTTSTTATSILEDETCYTSTPLSISLATQVASAIVRQTTELVYPACLQLPGYLESINHSEPDNLSDDPFQAAIGSIGTTYFDWLQMSENSLRKKDLEEVARLLSTEKCKWMELFDPAPLISEAFQSTSIPEVTLATEEVTQKGQTAVSRLNSLPLLVVEISQNTSDTDSGNCHNTVAFRRRFPSSSYPGTVELLVQPTQICTLVQDLELGAHEITLVSHDLRSPLKPHSYGARIYLLDSVLRHWPDRDARKILTNVAKGMAGSGTSNRRTPSKLLICDVIIPEKRAHTDNTATAALVSASDMWLMTSGAGKERTESEWRDLVNDIVVVVAATTTAATSGHINDGKDASHQEKLDERGATRNGAGSTATSSSSSSTPYRLCISAIHTGGAGTTRSVIECELR